MNIFDNLSGINLRSCQGCQIHTSSFSEIVRCWACSEKVYLCERCCSHRPTVSRIEKEPHRCWRAQLSKSLPQK